MVISLFIPQTSPSYHFLRGHNSFKHRIIQSVLRTPPTWVQEVPSPPALVLRILEEYLHVSPDYYLAFVTHRHGSPLWVSLMVMSSNSNHVSKLPRLSTDHSTSAQPPLMSSKLISNCSIYSNFTGGLWVTGRGGRKYSSEKGNLKQMTWSLHSWSCPHLTVSLLTCCPSAPGFSPHARDQLYWLGEGLLNPVLSS